MRIVLMGDLHYPLIDETVPGLKEARDIFYQTVINRFLDIDADLYVSIGDLTNFGHVSELREIYSMLRRKEKTFIHVLGNHDLYAQPRDEVLILTGQERYHSVTTDEAVFAFLDTAKEMDFEDWGGSIDSEQLHWFEEVVQQSGSKPLLVFAHHPVYKTTRHSEQEKGSIHPEIDMWRILDQKEGVGVYLNGHTHVDSIVQQKQWTFIQVSAFLDQPAFRIIDISNTDIRVTASDLTDDVIARNAPVIYNNMDHFSHTKDARGQESDRQCTITLKQSSHHLS